MPSSGLPLRLENTVQEYPWGSRTAIPELLGLPSPAATPQAELWMGAHPRAPSRALTPEGPVPLPELIRRDPRGMLGPAAARRFGGELPFLFKVLAAAEPLSIQVHPDARQARRGFRRETARGLSPEDPRRNYRDPHPKPEIICALTPFWALHGDTIFESGLFMEGSGTSSTPTLHYRDSVTLAQDQNAVHARTIPPIAKDSLGVWLADIRWGNYLGRERWREALVMDLGRGNLLFPNLWGDVNLLEQDDVAPTQLRQVVGGRAAGDAAADDDDARVGGEGRGHGIVGRRTMIQSRSAATPATTAAAPAIRRQPKPSFSTSAPMPAANSTDTSRNAATTATGARVIAQSAMP